MTEAVAKVLPKKDNMRRAWIVTLAIFLAGFCMPANMGKVMWLAPFILPSYGITEGTLGWLIGVFYLLGAVVAFPAASFIKRIGIRNTVVIALACGIGGGIIGLLSSDIAMLMVSRVIEGAGFGLMGVVGVAAISPWFPVEKRGLPLGIWAAWVAIANAVTPMIDTSIASATGNFMSVWVVYIIFDIAVLIFFLAVYRIPSDPYIDESEKAGDTKFSYKEVFTNSAVWALAAAFFFDEGAFIACQGFFSTYATTQINAPIWVGSLIVSLSAFGGALFAPIAGKISDKIGSRFKVLVVAMICGVVYCIVIFWAKELWLFVPIVIIQCIAGGGVPSMLWASTTEVVPSKLITGATAAMACSQSIGMFLGSMFMGNVIEAFGSYTYAAWAVMVPCYIIALIITIFVLRKKLR